MKRQVLILSLILSAVSTGFAQSDVRAVSIALPNLSHSEKKPASDLLKDGQVLDVGLASQLAEKGFDLSDLNPQDNKFWQNKTYSISDASSRNYPKATIGVKFVSSETSIKATSLHLVQSAENPNLRFRLGVSFYSQAMMMRAALLRKLGFFVASPQYYSNLKVSFKNENEKETFLEQLAQDLGSIDLSARQWILSDNKNDHSLVLASSILESVSSDSFDLYLGTAPNPDDPAAIGLIQRFSRNRAWRALIVPYALVDVPESVNRFSVRFGSVSSGFVSISHDMAGAFQACTYEDARWALKKLQTLSLKDYQDIVHEAHYPAEIEPVVLAKLINRSRDALSLFQLSPSIPEQDLHINGSTGLVVDGKVTKETVEGYPQRFAHGDRSSPFEPGDFMRFLGIEGKTSGIASVIGKLNEQLQFINTSQDARAKAYQSFAQTVVNRIRANPHQNPIHQEVISYPSHSFGLNINASRHVSTGTYSGSTAPVQLVDNLSISAGLGVFQTLENISPKGIQNVIGLGANVSVVRDYTHVKPILAMKDTKNVPWQNIMVPSFMKDLSQVLTSAEQTSAEGVKQKSIDKFLSDMQDGEVFSISDSVATTASVNAGATMDVLFGIQPLNFVNTITLGADANRVILRQISFHRVINSGFNGIHVYVRQLKNNGVGLEFNANYFINLIRIRARAQEADIHSDGFIVKYKDPLVDQADPDSDAAKKFQQTQEDLRLALLPLFKNNNPDLLYKKFSNKKFEVQHDLKEKEASLKFLAWRFSKFKEDHQVDLTYPKSDLHPELDPKKEKITLFSAKRGELKGRDIFGFGLDTIDGILSYKGQGKNVQISRAMTGDNPANAPLGKAYWRLINTESDLTNNNATNYPSVGMIQHVWGGWSLKKPQFLKVIDELKKEIENTEIASYPIIDPNEFLNVKSVDFYRITANLSILQAGLERIRDLLLQPTVDSDKVKPSALYRLVHQIHCAGKPQAECGQKFRIANDQEFFQELLKIFGNGDINLGKEKYKEICEYEKNKNYSEGPQPTTNFYKGVTYECLSDWTQRLIKLSHSYPQDKINQTRWMSQVLSILDENIPLPQLLKFIGQENYIFLIRINGFRVGDEDGDLQYFSNTIGDPQKDYSYAGGLINLYIKKTGLMPTELDRTLGGFQ